MLSLKKITLFYLLTLRQRNQEINLWLYTMTFFFSRSNYTNITILICEEILSLSFQTALTKYHRLGCLLTTEIYFSTFGRWSPRWRHLHAPSGEDPLPGPQLEPSSQWERDLREVSFIRKLIPFMTAWVSWPTKALSPNTMAFSIKMSTYEFGEDTNIQTTADKQIRILKMQTKIINEKKFKSIMKFCLRD